MSCKVSAQVLMQRKTCIFSKPIKGARLSNAVENFLSECVILLCKLCKVSAQLSMQKRTCIFSASIPVNVVRGTIGGNDTNTHCDDLTSDDLQDLTSLNTYFVDSFAGLGSATNLTTLYVSNTSSVSKQMGTSDIEQLPTSLETLTLNNIDIAPNTDFSRLTSLRALYLTVGDVSSGDYWATQLSSLSPLFDSDNHYDVTVQGMFPASLTTLSVARRTSVTFPAFFTSLVLSDGSALPALTTLDLSGTNVVDLSPLPATVTSLNLTQKMIEEDDEYESTHNYRDLTSVPSTVTELIVGSMAFISLDFIDNLPNLVHLEILNCNMTDLSKLSQVKETLEYFRVNNCTIYGDLTVLSELDNLTFLELSEVDVYFPYYPDLSSLTKLTHLDLNKFSVNSDYWDVSWILSLPPLEYLDLMRADITNFDATTLDTENLKVLKIDFRVDDDTFLSDATNMESFAYGFEDYCFEGENVFPDISNMSKLRELTFGCYDVDSSMRIIISKLTSLESLTFNYLSESVDISFVSSLSFLKTLYIGATGLTDATIPSLPSLEYLRLPKVDSITAVPDLATLPKLRILSWIEYSLTDFSNLSTAPSLQSIAFSSTSISDATSFSSAVSSLTGLTDLIISVSSPGSTFDLGSATDLRYLKVTGSWSDMSEAVLPPNVRILNLEDINFTTGPDLSSLTSIEVLDFGYSSNLSDISILATESCYSIKKLSIRRSSIVDISPLSKMTSLEYLSLYYSDIIDISPLSSLVSLKYLNLSGGDISDVSPLSSLVELNYLGLYGENITDISPLSSLVELNYLDLASNNISDVSPLSSLQFLTNFYIYGNAIEDASSLSSLTSLVYFYICENSISDISFISSMTELRWLDVSDNNISSLVSSNESLKNLVYFCGYNNIISDISFVASLESLLFLEIESNQIGDISPLSSLPNVFYYGLDDNKISDVSPLFDISKSCDFAIYFGLSSNNICLGSDTEETLIGLFNSDKFEIDLDDQTCNCPSLDPDSDSTIAAISEGLVCSETAPSSETWAVTCMSDSYYTYSDSDTFTCTRSADCSGGCGYGSECRANSDGTHSCASVVPDVALHGCVSDMIDAADKVAVGDGTYEFGVASLKNTSASTSLTCPSSSVSSLAGVEHIGSMTAIDVSSNSIADISPLTTLSALTSIDVHSNQISDVSVLINENGSTTPLPPDVLLSLNISDNLICDIADVNSELTSYFTNSSFSLESSESEQTCMCSPEPDFSENEICSKNSSDIWASQCWNGYYLDGSSDTCIQFDNIPDPFLLNDVCLALDHGAHCDDLTSDDLQDLTSLNTYFVDSFAGLGGATNLTTLYVSNTSSVSKQMGTSDIEQLPTSLETLTLNNIDIAPNTDFSRLTSLRALYLTVGDVSSGDYWATQLSSLSPLFDSDNHYDVTVQGMFPASLTTLSVAGRTSVTFPAFFTSLVLSDGSALPALTTLDLSGTNVVDLSPLPATVTSLNLTQPLVYDDYFDLDFPINDNIRDLSSIPSSVTGLTIGYIAIP
ncbi:hypothetical protein ADUPG1_000598, partial [Aduncisulcus paluster]